MNLSKEKGTMSTASSGSVVPDQFPVGLRVLVVDDDPTCLRILEKMLRTCLYDVTKCNRAEHALSLLRGNKNGFDVVISDVHMPDMDGFKLLEFIGLEMDLPVIMMSADDSKSVVMKGVTHGACDYLIKPVRIEALKNIWQHVVRKKKNEWKELEQSGSVEEGDRQPKPSEDADYSSSANEGNWRNSKRRKDDEDDTEEREDTSTLKKQRVVWSVELHQQFVAAVNQLGIDKAVPKKILELMNVPGLTRENVASHLQKYRLYLRRLSGVTQHQSNTFITPQEATYGTLTSLNGFDLQTLAATGQFPGQSLATLQAAGLGRSTVKSGIAAMPIVDQRNLFSFDNPKLSRYGDGQPQQKMNLLHGIPTSVEPKQLVNLHHSTQLVNNPHGGPSSQSSSILMHMGQSQSRGPIGQQPVLSNGISRNGVVSENGRTMGYNTITQNSPMLNFPLNQSSELPGNSFPLASAPGISTLVSKGPFNADIVNAEIKGSAGFAPSYDIFNDLQQHKPQNNWELQSVGLNFEGASQSSSNSIQGSINVTPSVLINQSYSTSQRNGQNSNSSMMGKTMFSVGGENEHLNNLIADNNSIQVKTERASSDASCQPGLFPQHFGQDDLMSALLKQQDSIGPAEHDFEFDGYSLDNISV